MSSKKRKIDEISEQNIDDKLVPSDDESVQSDDEDYDESFLKSFNDKEDVVGESWEDKLHSIIIDIEDKSNTYLDYEKIISDFKQSLLNNREGPVNRCLECNIDMGRCNPRQLCCKTYCSESI